MNPVKAKELIPVVAAEAELPVELVEAVYSTFWQETRRTLGELPALKVHVPNLGDFNIKHWIIQNKISRLDTMISMIEADEKPKIRLLNRLKEHRDRLYSLASMKSLEDQRRDLIYELKKNKTDADEKAISDLEQ